MGMLEVSRRAAEQSYILIYHTIDIKKEVFTFLKFTVHLLMYSSLNQSDGTGGFFCDSTNIGGRKYPYCPLLFP